MPNTRLSYAWMVLCLLGLWFLEGSELQAQTTSPDLPKVLGIQVEGNDKVSAQQILRWFAVRPGDPYDQRRVLQALKTLTTKGRFSDARLEGEVTSDGVILYIVVEEFPQLKQLRIEGEDKIDEDDLRPGLALRAKAFVSPWLLRTDKAKISERYRDKGYFRATVHDSLIANTDGTFDLVLRIDEGEKASIKQIVFTGNENATSKKLRKQMETGTDGIFSGGELKTDVLQQDFESIASYYESMGYLDAQVVGHELDLAANGKDLTVRIHVEEGIQYVVGDVTWEGNSIFTDERIQQQVQLVEGEPFNEALYEATTTAIYELYQDRGYFYFNAAPRRDVRGNVVNLRYVFMEGSRAKLNHIRISGNSKTHDEVILREFHILPGDTFDRAKLMRSIRDVFAMGYFNDIQPNVSPRSDSLVDIDLRVEERQTGQLGAGAGFSATNGLTGFFEMAETNFLGEGKRMSFRWEFSKRRNDISFSYTQPWLFNTPTTLTFDLFSNRGRSRINDFYRVERTGGAIRVGRRLRWLDYTTVFWNIRGESLRFTDFDSDVPDSLRALLGENRNRFTTGFTLRRNSTDNPFFPSQGSDAEWSTSLAGTFLGGDESFSRNDFEITWFKRTGISRFTFMLQSKAGFLHGLEGRVVPNDVLYRLGGVFTHRLRGYDDFEIVPRGNARFEGGSAMSIFTAELRYPISQSLHSALFFDAGDTWNSFSEADLSHLRKGAGFGFSMQVPMLGLIGIDFGYGFDRIGVDGTANDGWNTHFRFGNFF